jgi:multidrug efflux system outer membrane protein
MKVSLNRLYFKKIKKGKLYFLSVVLLLTACKVGPHYKRPNVIDESWSWKNQTIQNTTAPKNDSTFNTVVYEKNDSIKLTNQWWQVFGDDSLNELIDNAFGNNPSLRTAAFRIMEARGLVDNSRSSYFPVLTLDPNMNRNQLSGNRPSQFSNAKLPELRLTTISVPLDMTYELDVWGKFRRGVEASNASMRASQADFQVVKLNLASDISSNYFMLRLTDSQIQLYNEALKLRQENLILTNSQYTAGITTKLDVLQAEIEMNTVESQLIDIKRSRAMSENAIAVLCGIPVMNFKISPRYGLPKIPLVPLEVPSDLLQRRPDIVEAEQQLIYANAQIGIADAAFLPTVKLSAASAGFLSSRFDNLFDKQSQTWIGGVGVSIPLFAGGKNIAQKKIAEARLKESQSTYKQVVLNAFREVEDALVNIQYRAQQASVQQKALSSARLSANMSKELYKKGLTTYINVITADRAVLDAENTNIGITGQRLLYSISLIKALGGGWNGK